MKNFKKVLVLLVAVAMIFSMVPSTSFAWADTENAVDTGDDSSSVFVVEEDTTEEIVEEEAARAATGSIMNFGVQLDTSGLTNKNGNLVYVMSDSAAGQSVTYNIVWTVNVPSDSYAVGELEVRLPRSIFYHYVFNEDGTIKTDGSGNPVRELDQDSEDYKTYSLDISPGFPYTLTEDGDDLVLTNNQEIRNTQSIHQFNISYYMTHESFDYADYENHTTDMGNSTAHTCEKCGSRPMVVTITDLESDAVYTATSDEVYLDTSAKIGRVEKTMSLGVSGWDTQHFGQPEANSDNYQYVQYVVKIEMEGNPTERFKLELSDLFTDNAGNGDGIVAYKRYPSGSWGGYTSDDTYPLVKFDEPQQQISFSYDNCTEKYFFIRFLVRTVKPTSTDEFDTLHINQSNKINVVATPICGKTSEITRKDSTATYSKDFEYSKPDGSYMVRKFGTNNMRTYAHGSSEWSRCSYELTQFQNDPLSELDNFRFVVDFYGNATLLTFDTDDWHAYDHVGKKTVIWELLDDGSNIALKESSDINSAGTHLTSEDYYISNLVITPSGVSPGSAPMQNNDYYYDIGTNTWKPKEKGDDFYNNDIITLYVQKGDNGEWIKAANLQCKMVELVPPGTSSPYKYTQYDLYNVDTDSVGDITIVGGHQDINGRQQYSGSTIVFSQKDISGFRITNENKHSTFCMTAVPEYVLRHSPRVDSLINGKDEITLYNEADMAVYESDPDNTGATDTYERVFLYSTDAKAEYQVNRKATDTAAGEKRTLEVDKAYKAGKNSGPDEAYITTWKMNAAVWYVGGDGLAYNPNSMTGNGSKAEYELQHGGIFYDLLPRGTGVDKDSIRIYKAVNGGYSSEATTFEKYLLNFSGEKYLLTKDEDYTVDVTYDAVAKQYMFVIDITGDSLDTYAEEKFYSDGHNLTAKLSPGYTVYFDTKTSWNALDDFGKIITNAVGYKTDGLHTITSGNNANNVAGSELHDLSDEARYNVDYAYTIAKMKSVVDAHRDFLAFDFAYASTKADYNTSSVTGVYKRVQTEDDAAPALETTVGPGKDYKYSLRYQSGAVNEVKDIVIYDNIENFGEWDWRGTFKGFDFSELPDEVTPTVYYTTQDVDFNSYLGTEMIPINDTANINWQELTSSTDLSTVRSVAISMGDYVMGSYSSLTVWLNFEAPAENATDKPLPVAKNDTYVTVNQNGYVTMAPGNDVAVALEVLGEIKIHKVDDLGEPMDEVQFTLTGTDKFGRPVNLEDTTNARGNLTFSDLPISGAEGYTLTEVVPNGYIDEGRTWTVTVNTDGTTEIDGEAVSDAYYEIVNHEETSAFADKKWLGLDGKTDPPAGASVEFTLLADGAETDYSVTLDGTADTPVPTTAGGYESKPWTATFVHLPKYKTENGQTTEIVYTIKETVAWPTHTPSTTDGVASGEAITNTEIGTELFVTKAWKNADGSTTAPNGAEVTFTLYADGAETDYTVTLDGTADTAVTGTGGYESEAWKAKFVNLPKYKIVNGRAVEIRYTVKETGTWPGYVVSYNTGVVDAVIDYAVDGGTITNIQEETVVVVKKAWENADGTTEAPDGATVTFTLYADGTKTDYTAVLDGTAETTVPEVTAGFEPEAWTAAFVNLPKYKIVNGSAVEIAYTVAETGTWAGYEVIYEGEGAVSAIAGETISNVQKVTELSVKKIWENADGTTTAPDGATVTFTLYADGTITNYTVTLDGEADTALTVTGGYESAAWTSKFVKLPKYRNDNGKEVEIVYTVQETGTWPGYTVSYGDGSNVTYAVDGGTITNTEETVSLSVKKAWMNADGSTTAPDGAKVTFTLYADGDATDITCELDGSEDEEVPAYTGAYELNPWQANFDELPKYKIENGKAVEIEYTVQETGTWPGYTVSYGDGTTATYAVAGGTITNTQETTGLSVTKAWKNADGSTTAPAGAQVTFTLYGDGEPTGFSVTLVGTDNAESIMQGGQETPAWTASFVRLPKYKIENGKAVEIEYTVQETGEWPGYTVSYGDNEETFAVDGGVITNEQITTEIGGTKTWNDDEFFVDGVPVNGYQRPESITIDLLADGTVIDSTTVTEDDDWEYEFTDLPKYKIVDGQAVEIEYTVAEETVPGYAAVVEGTDVENTPAKDENVAPTMMFLRKVDALTWTEPINDDPEDPPIYEVMRAESVDIPGLGGAEFTLTDPNGGEKVLTTDENGTLTIEFTKDGIYTLKETKAPDGYQNPGTLYTITVDKVFQRVELVDDENAPGGKVWRWFYQLEADVDADYDANTNTLTVKDPPELINIEGEKIWDDGNDIEGKRPKNITVELFADGEKIDEQVVTSANNWKFTFTDLPKMKDGKEIVYTIGELPVKDYTTIIEGFKITNKHEIKTGDEMNLGLWISIMIMAIAAMCILGVARLLKRR